LKNTMSAESVAAIVGVVALIGQACNVFLFLRIRVAQLEGEKRVLDEVEKKYVRKDSCAHCRFQSVA